MPLRLSKSQVNAYVLHKQHLAPRSRGRDVASVVREVGPIRGRPAIIAYLSLWSRIEGFRREQLDWALYGERTVARFPCMHAQLYIMSSEDLPAYHRVTNAILQPGSKTLVDDLLAQAPARVGPDRLRRDQIVQRVLEVVSTRGPCTVAELSELLPALNTLIPHDPDDPESGHARLGARLIPALCAQGLLVRARPRGSWRSDLYAYASLSSWLPQTDLEDVTAEEALRHVVLAYVSAFGPVTVGDVSHWLGDVRRRQVVATLMALRGALTRLQIHGAPGEYFMLKDQVDDLLDYGRDERTACLLPPRDSYPMAYSRTSRFLSPQFRERTFDRAGDTLGTIWADGCVVGVWWLQTRDERIRARLFEPLDPEAMALVAEEAHRLARFLAFSSPDIGIGLYADEGGEGDRAPALDPLVHPWLERSSPRF